MSGENTPEEVTSKSVGTGEGSAGRELWLADCGAHLVARSGISAERARVEAEMWLDDVLDTDTTESTPEQAAKDIMSYWAV